MTQTAEIDVFSPLREATVVDAPFPHVVVSDFLDRDLIDALDLELPPLHVLSGGRALESYERLHFSGEFLLSHPGISDTWKSLVRAAMDQRALSEIVTLFSPGI